jgi:hypothetical protein
MLMLWFRQTPPTVVAVRRSGLQAPEAWFSIAAKPACVTGSGSACTYALPSPAFPEVLGMT